MDEKNINTPAPPETSGDQALFDALGKDKKKKKLRRWITAVLIVGVLTAGITVAVRYGRRKVDENFSGFMGGSTTQVNAYTVDSGSVTTTVSGSGQLADVDSEKLTLPAGVEVKKLLVKAGERVEEGQLLATVETSSVLSTLTDTQAKLSELDRKLANAAFDKVPITINAGVNGRVKAIYAQPGDDVAGCMMRYGALAVLSLDGNMAVNVESESLSAGDSVRVVLSDGKEVDGTVESAGLGEATVLISDDGPALDEEVTVRAQNGEETAGVLYIHSPLRVTGYAGTVNNCNVKENQQVWRGNRLFALKDTETSANYEAILKDRREQEERLLTLMGLYTSGGVTAPFTGSVSSVEYKDPSTSTGGSTGSGTGSSGGYEDALNGGSGTQTEKDTELLTLSPDVEMTLAISVDETNILSLQLGQKAQITINSIEEVFPGTVTEINRLAEGSENESDMYSMGGYTGVTNYTATITLPQDPRMLPGMSAKALVRIDGSADALLIPSAALHQSGDNFFVYTSVDPATDELGGAVRVVPGLNDGNMVEIVEGLSNGDTVYYLEVVDPYMYMYGYVSDGDAVWVEDAEELVSDGDAAEG